MRKTIVIVMLCVLVLPVIATVVPQPVAGMTGSGIPGDPYMIYNATDLQDMDLALDAWYELANDIDASNTSTWNGGAGFDPVGTSVTPFTGHFNGNGYTISDLTINRPTEDYVGLFGYVDGSSGDHVTIDNVVLTGINYTGDDVIGGLVGQAFTYTDISYCDVEGCIDGAGSPSGYMGGLIGFIDASYTYESVNITRCRVIVDIDAGGMGDDVGGFIGRAYKGTVISECCTYGEVRAHQQVGGFVGEFSYGTISDCLAFGDVYMTDNGGAGQAQDGGGFLGVCGGYGGTPYRCYSIGTVYCEDVHGCTNRGCFAGQVTTSCVACFWDKQVTSCTSSACGTGKFTSEMQTQSTFENAGWDFDTIWAIDLALHGGYPYLQWMYDITQVVWFQPNAIIAGITLPNRAPSAAIDGEIHWGNNPTGLTFEQGMWTPESDYEFAPITGEGPDIIQPDPSVLVGDVDTTGLVDNPVYPLVQLLGGLPGLNERLVWLGLAFLVVIVAMLLVHIGFDTKKGTEKPQHFVLTTITGLGLSIFFYVIGIFPLWVVIIMAFGLVGAIIYERQPVL